MYQVEFESGTPWEKAYQRNNKSKEQKNLRCFPSCSFQHGHQEGFCGRSIKVNFRYPENESLDNIKVIAEFAPEEKPLISNGEHIDICTINKQGLTSEQEQDKLYIRGIPSKCQGTPVAPSGPGTEHLLECDYEFNRMLKGWHYGYMGSKKTRDSFHTFRVYVLRALPPAPTDDNNESSKEMYEVLCSVQSPRWQMYCRRRKHPEAIPKISANVESSPTSASPRLQTSSSESYGNTSQIPTPLQPPQQPGLSLKRKSENSYSSESSTGSLVKRQSYQYDDIENRTHSQNMGLGHLEVGISDEDNVSGDSRFQKWLVVVRVMRIPTPIEVKNLQLPRNQVEPFADRIYEFLQYWHRYQFFALKLPSDILNEAGISRYGETERFAAYMLNRSEFQQTLTDYITMKSPFTKPIDPIELSVFILKQTVSFFRPFIERDRMLRTRLTGRKSSGTGFQMPTVPLLNLSISTDNPSRGSHSPDTIASPRGFNYEDMDLLRNSLVTPRNDFASAGIPFFGRSGYPAPMLPNIHDDNVSPGMLSFSSLQSPKGFGGGLGTPMSFDSSLMKKGSVGCSGGNPGLRSLGGSFYLSKNMLPPMASPGLGKEIDQFVTDTNYLDSPPNLPTVENSTAASSTNLPRSNSATDKQNMINQFLY